MSGRAAGGSTGWLARLLNLVPYLLARPGIRIAEAAADLGVSPRQLRADLELLWVCGLPGYGPGDLIDMAFDGDRVTITYDAGINRPLRLTRTEALSLTVALRLLAATPGLADRAPVERALAKIEKAAGEPPPVAVRIPPTSSDRLDRVRQAVADGRALELTYYSATNDRTTTRVVDPMRVVVVDGHGYLEAWCRLAGQVRRFRVDRIEALTVLDEPAAPPAEVQPPPLDDGVFHATPELPLVTLRVGRTARWITEYYPCEQVQRGGDRWLVSLRVANLDWARRLVLGLGPDVTVVAPAELADRVRSHAAAALAAYESPTGLAPPPA